MRKKGGTDLAENKMFDKMYLANDKGFDKRRFFLLLICSIAVVCFTSYTVYSLKRVDFVFIAVVLQTIIFLLSVSNSKKYEPEIKGNERTVKITKYAIGLLAVKIAVMVIIISELGLNVIAFIFKKVDSSILMVLPDIFGCIAVAAVLCGVIIKLNRGKAVYNKYFLISYAIYIASFPWIFFQLLLAVIIICFHGF